MRNFGGETSSRVALGNPKRWWVNNTKVDVREIVCHDGMWNELDQNRAQWRAWY